MNWEFICYGGGDIYQSILTSVALAAGTGAMDSLIRLTFVLGLILVMIKTMTDANVGAILRWFFMAAIIWGVMWVPKVTLHVTDKTNPAYVYAPVPSVPLGVGVSAAIVSEVGSHVIDLFETAFNDPSDTQYSKDGMVYGAKMMEKVAAARPFDQIFAQNLNAYMGNCAYYDLLDGTVNIDTASKAGHLWQALTVSPNPARMSPFTNPTTGAQGMATCSDLKTMIDGQWAAQNTSMLQILAKTVDPNTADADALTKGQDALNAYLSLVNDSNQTAQDLVENAATRNSLYDAVAAKGSETANTPLSAFAQTYADSQTHNVQTLLGSTGEKAIPILKILVECLFIGIFPALFPLFLMPGIGWQSAKLYLVGFVYLQLWAPMYVILHKIMMFYAYQHTSAATYALGGEPLINMMNMDGVAKANGDICTLAGSMMLMIPVLAGLVTRGAMSVGAQGEALLGQFRSGAEAGGSMMTSGNIQVGHTSFEEHGYLNTSANKLDTSSKTDTDNSSVVLPGGGVLTTGNNGAVSYQGATSNFGAGNLHFSDTAIASKTRQLQDVQSEIENRQTTYSDAKQRVHSITDAVIDNVTNGRMWNDNLSDRDAYSVQNTVTALAGGGQHFNVSDAKSTTKAMIESMSQGVGASTGIGGSLGKESPAKAFGSGEKDGVAAPSGGLTSSFGGQIKSGYDQRMDATTAANHQSAYNRDIYARKDVADAMSKDTSQAATSSYEQNHGSSHTDSKSLANVFSSDESVRRDHSFLQSKAQNLQNEIADIRQHSSQIDASANNDVIRWASEKGMVDLGEHASVASFFGRMDRDVPFANDVLTRFLAEKMPSVSSASSIPAINGAAVSKAVDAQLAKPLGFGSTGPVAPSPPEGAAPSYRSTGRTYKGQEPAPAVANDSRPAPEHKLQVPISPNSAAAQYSNMADRASAYKTTIASNLADVEKESAKIKKGSEGL